MHQHYLNSDDRKEQNTGVDAKNTRKHRFAENVPISS